ncbi:MAG: hypothetical protein GC134_01045 [Proteobacteria bacterium]|nr:hypothetical protein [Pseudomonadota bacterium]
MSKKTLPLLGTVDAAHMPYWLGFGGRLLIGLFLLVMPVVYDRMVPEVSGDMRWTLVHFTSGLCLAGIFAFFAARHRLPTLSLPLTAWAVVGLMLWVTFCTLNSFDPVSAKQELFNQLAYMGLFLAVMFLRDAKWYRNLLWLMALPMAFNCLLAILQFLDISDATMQHLISAWPSLTIDYFRPAAPPAGTMSNKNLLGSYLAMCLPVFTILALTTRSLPRQLLAAVVFGLAATTFAYTRSRGSWVALFIGAVLCVAWLILDKQTRTGIQHAFNRRSAGLFGVALAIAIVASFVQSPLQGFHSLDKSVSQQVGTIIQMGQSDFGTRIAYNLNGFKMFMDKPITGWGVGSFHKVYPKYHNAWMATPTVGYAIDARPQRAHNDWLQAFIELGLPGGLLLLFIVLSSVLAAFKLARDEDIPAQERALFAGLTISLMVLGVNALGDFPLQMPTAPILMWTFMGMISGTWIMHKRKQVTLRIPAKMETAFNLVPRGATLTAALCSVAVGLYTYTVWKDDMRYRRANMYLKRAMYDVRGQIYSEETRKYIEKAYSIYPEHPRIQEFRAVIYANYADPNGKEIATDTKIAAVEATLKNDPYAPNNLVNLGGLYMAKMLELLSFQAPKEEVIALRDKALELADRLQAVADFSAQTYTIRGFVYLYTDNSADALAQFKRAVAIDPAYVPAVNGLSMAEHMNERKGWIHVGPATIDKL